MSDHSAEIEEFERECRRVGVTWNAFLELDRLNAGEASPSPDGSISIEGGLRALADLLRSMPDSIGDVGFLETMAKRGEESRARAEEATRRTLARRRSPGPTSGESGV